MSPERLRRKAITTYQHLRVAQLTDEGYSQREIAKILNLARATVQRSINMQSIYRTKLFSS